LKNTQIAKLSNKKDSEIPYFSHLWWYWPSNIWCQYHLIL